MLSGSESRSQHQNKEAVTARFAERPRRRWSQVRRKTRPSRASKEAAGKKQRSQTKKMRRAGHPPGRVAPASARIQPGAGIQPSE